MPDLNPIIDPSAAPAVQHAHPAPQARDTNDRYSWFVLIMLMGVYSFSWMDRSLLVILVDPISKDLHVSNTQIGLLTGFGASLLYSLAGFPIARLADHASRTRIISSVLGIWSGLTVATAAVGSFFTLLLTRFGIAIASAGCSPAAYSLISDYFPARKRGTAIAIYSLGISIGTWAGLSLGGWAADTLGWRHGYLLLGMPGVLFAALLFFVLKEPRRGRYDEKDEEIDRHFSTREATAFFLGHRALMALAFGFGLIACGTSAFENWIPTYLIRAKGLSATEVGAISGLFQGLTGIIGALAFGIVADYLARRDRRWYIWIPVLCTIITTPLIVLFFHVPQKAGYTCYFLIEFCISGYSAPLFAASQLLLPPRLRAFGMAAVLFVLNVVGQGMGPFLTGFISDLIGSGPAGGLGSAIMMMQAFTVAGMLILFIGAPALRKV